MLDGAIGIADRTSHTVTRHAPVSESRSMPRSSDFRRTCPSAHGGKCDSAARSFIKKHSLEHDAVTCDRVRHNVIYRE